MMLAVDIVVLLWIWDFLGAVYIGSDIHLALQSHAVERQFNNWVFHVLIDEQVRCMFENVDFFCAPVHPCVSGRLKGSLDLLKLRCVNKDINTRCLDVLKARSVVVYELVCASRPIRIPSIIFANVRNVLSDERRREVRQLLGGVNEKKYFF